MSQEENMNELFLKIIQNSEPTLEDFKMILQRGFDPLCNNGAIFIISCGYDNIDIPKYLMEEYGIDMFINNYDECVTSFGSRIEIIHLLLDNGFGIRDTLVKKCLYDVPKLKILFDHGVDINLVITECCYYPEVIISAASIEFIVDQILATYSNHIYEENSLDIILSIYFSKSELPQIASI